MTHVDTPQSTCRWAVARRDITPPVGIYHRMWGAATHDRSTGVHRPLFVDAMVFESQEALAPEPGDATAGRTTNAARPELHRQVIVVLDHCLLWTEELESLRQFVCQQAGLEPPELLITFSHTHGAGLMGLERAELPGGELIRPYLDQLSGQVAEVVAEALDNLQPVRIVYGAGRCALAQNRDFWDADRQQFVCGFNPTGPSDDTVMVARITNLDDKLVGVVVNYACHPTTLAWDNTLISPDYVGALREVVEQATAAPCVFLQGASGDLGPREGFVGDPAVADRNGRQLAYAALAALEALPPAGTRFQYSGPVVSGATIGTWAHVPLDEALQRQKAQWRARHWTVDLPYRADLSTIASTQAELVRWQNEEDAARQADDQARARDCRAQVERMTRQLVRLKTLPQGESFPFPVSLWQIGDAFWLAVEGEHYHQLQAVLRRRCNSHPLLVATLTGGWRPTYLPTAETYGRGIYQEIVAVLAPGCLESLIDEVSRQIDAWLGVETGAGHDR